MASNKSGGKSFKSRIFILLTAVVVVLCAVALAVSVGVTSTMLKKQDQLAAAGPDAIGSRDSTGIQTEAANPQAEPMNLKKAEKRLLFFNGRQEEAVYYASDDGKFLLPIDTLLDDLKINYSIFNSDDIFSAEVNGGRLLLDLGTPDMTAGDGRTELDTASVTAGNHVLASPGVLDYIGDLSFFDDAANKTGFVYNWPASMDKKYAGLKLFGFDGRALEIADISGGEPYKYTGTAPGTVDEAVYSGSTDSLLVKSGQVYYIISGKDYKKPTILDIKGSWSISSDGGFLYRVDDTGKYLLIYDVKSASLKKLKNRYSGVMLSGGVSLTDCRLLFQQAGSSLVRLDFEGPDGRVYTVISTPGGIAAQGYSTYSPDRMHLLLYDGSTGWSLSGSNGKGVARFQDVKTASWVDNGRILLETARGFEVYEIANGSRHEVEVPFYHVGEADDGRTFFAEGNDLYQIKNGNVQKLASLPWRSSYARSISANGPVIVVSEEADGVFALAGDTPTLLGKPGLFPNTPPSDAEDAGLDSNAAFSPGGDRLAILQKGEKFLEIDLLGLKDMKQDKLTLDYSFASSPANTRIFMKWLDNSSLLVYTDKRVWLARFENDDVYLREWTGDSSVVGPFWQK